MFQRKGTVSKSSGPVHVNSYALKGVPVKYTPPFFLPDQLTLPPSWALPTLPSDELFRYDYTKENKVLEQARIRAMSLAAEAQAREKREKAEEEKGRIEAAAAAERAKVITSTAELPPPLIPAPVGSTILTPTPAAPRHTLTNSPSTNNTNDTEAIRPQNADSATGGIHIKDSTNIIKPLGEMSFSEFEFDNFNPFDTASLQAINDMEILQSISLAPPPQGDPPPRPSGATVESERDFAGSSRVPHSSSVTQVISAPAAVGGALPQASAQFSGVPLPPIGGPASQPSFGVPTSCVPGSSSGIPISSASSVPLQGSPLPRPSLPILPVLPPIGTNLTHSPSDPTHTSTPSSSHQQPTLSSSQPPFPPYHPPRPQGTLPQPIQAPAPTPHPPPRPQGTLPQPTSTPTPTPHPLPRPQGTLPQPTSTPTPIPHPPPRPQRTLPQPTSTPTPPPRPQGTLPQPTSTPTPSPRPQGIPTQPPSTFSSSPITSTALPQPSLAAYPSLAGLSFPPTSTQFTPPPAASNPTLAATRINSDSGGGGGRGGGGGGGIGTLVNVGVDSGTTASPPVQQKTSQTPPVPKPRALPAAGQQVPNSAHLPYQPVPAPRANPSPVMTGAAPKPPPARTSVQARAENLMATLPQGQPPLSRPGLGVAVLPPIPTRSSTSPSLSSSHTPSQAHPPSSTSTTPSCPPPYQQQSPAGDGGGGRSNSPPPPYTLSPTGGGNNSRRFSQPVPLPSQQHTPSHFTLPDPQLSLSPDQKSHVQSMVGMGFPAPRVARAVRRFSGNHTQVVDFLIMVGGLKESSGTKGDSAEVALALCDNNEEKAKRYLQKVIYYRESGFSEKRIHEAYEKSGQDWDRALDILTQDTT